jgi:nucleotide-binding universal stress UspA family protein
VYEHVLVGTDGSVTASRAVEAAARLAHAHQARLTIVHAFPSAGTRPHVASPVPDELSWLQTPGGAADAVVASAIGIAQQAACGALVVDGRAEVGHPRAVLRALVDELRPDVVVVGNADARRSLTRRGLGAWLAGRTPADVVIVDTSGDTDARSGSTPAAA